MTTFVIREITSGCIIGDQVAPFDFASREEAERFIEDEHLNPNGFVVDEAEDEYRPIEPPFGEMAWQAPRASVRRRKRVLH